MMRVVFDCLSFFYEEISGYKHIEITRPRNVFEWDRQSWNYSKYHRYKSHYWQHTHTSLASVYFQKACRSRDCGEVVRLRPDCMKMPQGRNVMMGLLSRGDLKLHSTDLSQALNRRILSHIPVQWVLGKEFSFHESKKGFLGCCHSEYKLKWKIDSCPIAATFVGWTSKDCFKLYFIFLVT